MLQQCLPFTVLKLSQFGNLLVESEAVATVLTVYGIETTNICPGTNLYNLVATVLTVYGIETVVESLPVEMIVLVATVLTVYGIETA